MNKKQTAICITQLLFASCCVGACDSRTNAPSVVQHEPTTSDVPRSAAVEPAVAASANTASRTGDAAPAHAETALVLERSAYGVKLLVTASAWTLITPEGLFRKQGDTPVVRFQAVLSAPFAVMGQQLVHWQAGQLVATPLSGGLPKRLAALERMPREVFASNEHFAWLERSALGDSIFVVGKSITGRVNPTHRTVYRTEHTIVSGAMLSDWVFFVEALPNGQWRLGANSLHATDTRAKVGTAATFGPARSGRPPAFLVAETELYYYDGPTRSVRRVTPDLQEETTVAQGVICSPLAVASELYCAHVGGVFAVGTPTDGQTTSPIRTLDSQVQRPITAIAASSQQVVWVEDIDGKQLSVRVVRFPYSH